MELALYNFIIAVLCMLHRADQRQKVNQIVDGYNLSVNKGGESITQNFTERWPVFE
jgi:hypothetical protein